MSLAALFLRSRAARRAALPLFIAAMLGWTVLHLLVAVQLSPEQRVRATLGLADGSTEMAEQILAGTDLPEFFRPSKVDGVATTITVIPSWEGTSETVSLHEMPMLLVGSEERYELLSGRLPTNPGEVLLSPAAQQIFLDTTPRPILGQLPLTIVGTVSTAFATDSAVIVAAPGTWNTWNVAEREARIAQVKGQVTLYWTSDDADAAAAEYAAHVRGRNGSPSIATAAALRQQFDDEGSVSRFSRMLLAYGVPVAATLMIGGWLAGALGARIGGRILVPLRDVGVSSSMLRTTLMTALFAVSALMVLIAAACAYALLAAARPVIATLLTHPIRPWEWSTEPVLVTAALGLMTSGAGAWAALRQRRRRSDPVRTRRFALTQRVEVYLRWAAAPVLVVALFTASSGNAAFSSIAQVTICISVAVCLLTPTLLRGVTGIRVAPSATLAAFRFTRARLTSLGAYVALVVLLVSVTASLLAVVGGLTANLNATNTSLAPPGVAFTQSSEPGQPPPPELAAQFERDIGVSNPVTVWRGSDNGVVWMAFTSEQDVATVFGPLDENQRTALARGPIATTTSTSAASGAPRILVPRDLSYVERIDLQTRRTPEDGVVLGVYVGLTPDQDAAASDWDESNGIGYSFVTAHHAMEPFAIPVRTQLTATAFGIVIALIAYFMLRAEVMTYRPLLAGLHAVGLGERWVRRVIHIVGAVVGLICAVAGMVAVLINLVLVRNLLPESVLISGAPWIAITTMLASSVLGAVIGAGFAARGLHARERHV